MARWNPCKSSGPGHFWLGCRPLSEAPRFSMTWSWSWWRQRWLRPSVKDPGGQSWEGEWAGGLASSIWVHTPNALLLPNS